MINGTNLYFTDIETDDMEKLYEWFEDYKFLEFYDYTPPVPQSQEEVDKTICDYKQNKESKVFAIKKLDTHTIIGLAGLDDIIESNGVATLFIGIGDNSDRGKGYGHQSLSLLLEYGFEKLKLHRIQLQVLEFNDAAIKLYERAGFIKEGVFRQFAERKGKRYDLLLYGLLKSEWKKISS